jgi:hypothetical protein
MSKGKNKKKNENVALKRITFKGHSYWKR